jgi:hypothetical protein
MCRVQGLGNDVHVMLPVAALWCCCFLALLRGAERGAAA